LGGCNSAAECLLPKQDVEGSNPFTRSTGLASNCSQKFTKFTTEILANFLNSRASGINPRTLELYRFALDNFVGYPLNPQGINTYLNSLTCKNGKHNYYRVIKTLCRWLHHTGQLTNNPIENVSPPRRQKKILPAISKEQLKILVNHALTERDKVTLYLLWYSGMRVRVSEAANVRSKDFNWEEGTVVVLGKGNRYRKALAGNGIVQEWFTKHDSLELNAHGIQTMLQRLGQVMGIKCNAHAFRRGFCVHNVKSGLSDKVIQALGGWETPDMVSHYAASLTFDDALAIYRVTNQQ
jgi:integrase